MFKTILILLDGATRDAAAVLRAAELGNKLDADLVLLRIALAKVMPGLNPAEAQVAAVGTAQEYVARIEEQLRQLGLRVRSAVGYGSSMEAVLETVGLQGADMVVAAAPSADSANTATCLHRLLRRATVPVLVVPAGEARYGQLDAAKSSNRCHNCGAPVHVTSPTAKARCARCGYFLRTCANCAFYDGVICLMDDPQDDDRYQSTSCHDFHFRDGAVSSSPTPEIATSQAAPA